MQPPVRLFASVLSSPSIKLAQGKSLPVACAPADQLNVEDKTPAHIEVLPLGAKSGGKRQQYIWDGSRIVAVNQELLRNGYKRSDRVHDWLARLQDSLYHAFMPNERDVTPDYWQWLPWRCSQVLTHPPASLHNAYIPEPLHVTLKNVNLRS